MNNKKIIAEFLLDMAKNSKTEFIDVSEVDKELIDAAKKFGIVLPSPDLAIMKTVYAEIDKVNLNGVILPKKAVEKGLNTLIGKNCNWEHDGAGFVCGYTIDAKIVENKIETINVIFKSLFPEQADELKEKVKSGEAAVSFEIWNIDPETKKSVVKELDNGFKEISPIICHGTGVLLVHKPACPKAKIFKLVAKKEISEAEKIVDKVFNEDLIYAQLAIEEPKENEKEEKVMVKCSKCGKDFESATEETLCVECSSLPKEEIKTQSSEETKTEDKVAETQTEEKSEAVETKAAEIKVEETKEEVLAPKEEIAVKTEEKKEGTAEVTTEQAQPLETVVPKVIAKVTRIYSDEFVDTYVDGTMSGTSSGKSYSKKITEYADGTKDEVTSESEYKQKFDLAEVEEKVNAAKAEKDAEIVAIKADNVKILEEKDKEISKTKEELAVAKQPKEIVKAKEQDNTPDLTVGETETADEVKGVKKEAQNINDIIAKKHDRK